MGWECWTDWMHVGKLTACETYSPDTHDIALVNVCDCQCLGVP